MRSPPKFVTAKNRPKFCSIFDNLRLWSRISPEWIHISKIEKVVYQLPPLQRWVKKVGVIWSINEKVIEPNVYRPETIMYFFSGDYISALRGCCSSKFLHALETDQSLIAHTTTGTGVPAPSKKTRWAGQSPTWGRPSPQVRVESHCSYSKFLSQQWQLASNSKNCIAFYRRTTWHIDLRQLTVYEHFRWVNMRAITFLFVGQSSSRVWLWGYPH